MAVSVPNTWSLTFNQPATFQLTPPALESTVIALTPANSVGGGTGTPSAGNWLICITGWNQTAIAAATHAVADDIHSFWRPGDVTASNYAVSTSTGASRVSVWYTPNLALAPGNVYVAPSGAVDGRACLVVEVAGLGAWDVVTGIATNYAAGATSLSLSLGAPASQALVIGAVCGDLTGAGQAFAPASWTTLPAVTAQDGSTHTSDAVLTSAYIVTSGSVSVSASATGATDLSGVLIGIETAAASPIPATQNPHWPYMKVEAAFGSGFQTAPDQMTWTDLTSRCWAWEEQTGIQFELGEIQATNLGTELDNYDSALSSDNVGSAYYSNALNSNMSFQSGTSPWAGNDNAAIAQSATHVYASAGGATAQYSLQVTPDGVTAFPGAVSEKVAVSASAAYTASAWFYSVAGYNGAQVSFAWYTSGNAFISFSTSSTVNVPAATWTQVTETATSPANAAFATIIVQFSGTPAATPFWVAEAAFAAGSTAVSTGRVTTGVPLRIRAAIGSIGGVTANRWYVIQRNAQEWPQQITHDRRRVAPVTGTDIWASTSAYGTSPYRGEVLQDSPYAWWPCDDQPVSAGVQPTTLRNAAPGNSTALTITLSPNGASAQLVYATVGTAPVTNNTSAPVPLIAQYAVGQNSGWMYGDPQSSPFGTSASGGVVTAQPGSSAWTQTGVAGNTGSNAYFLLVNDTAFPALSSGITVEGWFNCPFFGTSSGQSSSIYSNGSGGDQTGQPYANITIIELATATAAVAVLQLDRDTGHLSLITYSGSTPTTNSVYTTADLRTNSWHHFAITLTTTTYAVYVDGGQTASVSGSATGMTSAWTYLLACGDTGTAGGTGTASIAHSGNMSLAHLAVYPTQLPEYRIIAHYWAGITAFGLLPAPQGVTATMIANASGGQANTWAGDGSIYQGTYTGTLSAATSEISAVVTANAGSYSSGPSAWAPAAAIGERIFAWVTWTTGLAPAFQVYTASSHGSETEASTTIGSGDAYSAGYGGSATGAGRCHSAGGTGASAPTTPTSTGDTVAQRLERILSYAGVAGLGYGGVISPCRAIDPAALLVQAATDVGGQQAGQNLTSIAQSDGGWLYVDNQNTLTYWQKSHLASQYSSPVWTFTPNAPPTSGAPLTAIPYDREIKWVADPQRIWNSVTITPFSPDGASLPLIIPTDTATAIASQEQAGAEPFQVTSYLQSTTEMQNQASWVLSNFSRPRIRVENLEIDAAAYPPAFPLVLGVNIGDIVTVQNWTIGNTGITGTFRVSGLHRNIRFAGEEGDVRASVTLQLDPEPSSYWS